MDKKQHRADTAKNKSAVYYIEYFTDKYKIPLAAAGAVLLTVLPFAAGSQYIVTTAVKIGIYTMLALGLNILVGYTGLVSLGHAGFVAIGAYTASLLAVKLGLGFFAAVILGMLAAGLSGLLVGLPTLRLSGTYLSIVSWALGKLSRQSQ